MAYFSQQFSGGPASAASGLTAILCAGPLPTGASHSSATASGSLTLHSGPIRDRQNWAESRQSSSSERLLEALNALMMDKVYGRLTAPSEGSPTP